jgi:hypothetical protein
MGACRVPEWYVVLEEVVMSAASPCGCICELIVVLVPLLMCFRILLLLVSLRDFLVLGLHLLFLCLLVKIVKAA